jgi:hypothetical protein
LSLEVFPALGAMGLEKPDADDIVNISFVEDYFVLEEVVDTVCDESGIDKLQRDGCLHHTIILAHFTPARLFECEFERESPKRKRRRTS